MKDRSRSSGVAAFVLATVAALSLYSDGALIERALADGGGGPPSGSVVPDAVSDAVAAIPAQFRVDESGAATYSIPISTVPGTAGVAPQLSLEYSSQGGYGPLGRGWSLGGTSAISRCRATREAGDFISGAVPVDGNPRPVDYSATDRYCLDGQRLLAAVDGAACAAVGGTTVQTLRTEIESFQRVCAYTAVGGTSGPAYFTVERKDGSISWYGDRDHHPSVTRPDGFVETNAPGHAGTAMLWAQTRFQDSSGNYIDYLYAKNPGSPAASVEHLLTEVRFTGKNVLASQGGSAKAPYAKLLFNYEMRPQAQWSQGHASGATLVQRWRMTSIVSCASAAPGACPTAEQARYYELAYATSVSGSGHELLAQVTECRDGTKAVCAAPTAFEWTAGKHEFASVERPVGPTLANDHITGYKLGDFNGDGRQDVAFQYLAGTGCVGGTWVVTTLSTLSGSGVPTLASPQFNCVPANIIARGDGAWHLFDYDGDGRDDLFVSRATGQGWQLHPSTGTGFNLSVNLIAGLSPAIPSMAAVDSQPQLADLNGDGLVDVIYPRGAGVYVRLMERQGGTFGWGAERSLVIDEASLWASVGHGCGQPPSLPGNPYPPECTLWMSGLPTPKTSFMQMADFNGDAASDVLIQVAGQVRVWTGWPGCQIPPVEPQAVQAPTARRRVVSRFQEPAAHATPMADPHDPCYETIHLNQLHALTVTTTTASSITLGNHALVAQGNPETVVLADANGDGLTEVFLRATASSDWYYRTNTGTGFTTTTTLPLSNYREHARFVDVTGDGRADLLYLVETGGNKVYHMRAALPGGGYAAGTPIPGGNARLCEGNGCNPAQRAPLFADLDGDGNLDFASFNFASSSFGMLVSRANTRFAPRDTVEGIVNGYGAATRMAYAPLTFKDLYRRDYNTRNASTWGRGAPVTDLLAPIYAVARASSSSPQPGDANAMAAVHYRYAGAKMQAGGRGFLGFRQIVSFDPNQSPGHHVASATEYRQDFPYAGMPQSTVKRLMTGAYAVPACLAGTVTEACFITPNQPFPALGGAVFSSATQSWEADADIGAAVLGFAPGVQRSLHVRTAATEEALRDPFHALDTSKVQTAFIHGAYGNVTQTTVATLTGAGAPVATVSTANGYGDDAGAWRLGRLTASTVTHARPGMASVVRGSSFEYDMAGGGPLTGQLLAERVQSGGGASVDLRTHYTLDAYGNRLQATTCAAPATDCASAPFVFQPATATRIHRYSRTVYDGIGRYPTETWEPFRTAGGSAEARTLHVVGRDLHGNVTRAYDVNGRDSFAVYGAMGRAYYAWTETVAASVPGDPAQGVASTVSYRWCGSGGANVACPAGAKFRQQTQTTAAPSQWSYFDALGRPVLQVTQSFNVGVSGKDASAVCTGYDAAGRPKQVSNPFFLPGTVGGSPAPAANTCTAPGLAWTTTHYDALGRPLQVTTPNDSGGTISVSTAYHGLTTTTTDPRGHTTAQTRNAAGEVVLVVDALGTGLHSAYRADGAVERIPRETGRGEVANTFAYDVLGRKVQQVDPDSGTTTFEYNALGELLAQQDAAGNRIESWYDARGRVWKKQVRRASGTVESESPYAWDTAANGQGQLAGESTSGTYDAWVGQSGTALDFSRSHGYDALGRPLSTSTVIDGVSYASWAAQYDVWGRIRKTLDASGRWAKTEYNGRGFAVAVCESSAGDDALACALNHDKFQWLLETDARGQVVRERWANHESMDLVRTFGAGTGRLARICGGNAGTCHLVDENYVWDAAGNLAYRTKEGRYAEAFSYDALDRLTEGKMTIQNGVTLGTPVVLHRAQFDRLGNVCSRRIDGADLAYGYQGRSGCGQDTASGSGTTGATGPHRVTSVGTDRSYSYDARGNLTLRDMSGTSSDRAVSYSLDDHAHQIVLGSDQTRYWYGPDGQRYKREHQGKRTLYLGNVEIETAGGATEIKRTVAGVMRQSIVNGAASDYHLFHDHLGSLVRVANWQGSILSGLDYHEYGQRRDYGNPQGVVHAGPAITNRGFTGHEHLDAPDMDLIHMNGRVYDPEIGRFLQADPIIQAPGNLQSWNAYSYVFNNPLKYTDPTGEFSWKKWWRPIVAIVVSVVTYGAASGWAAGWLSASVTAGTMSATTAGVFAGAIGGAAAGFTAGAITTGSLKGAVRGAFSGALFGGIGGYYGDTWNWGRVGAESLAGGISAEIGGGDFWDGFKFTFAISTLTLANYHMRASERALSSINPDNLGTDSSGFFGDGVGLAGARRQVGPDGNYLRCVSPAGGCQGQPMLEQDQLNNFFGIGGPYKAGSVRDRINESFAGPHDWFRNHVSRAYDPMGNSRVFTGFRLRVDQFANGALIPAAAPFAASAMLMTQRGLYMGYQVGYMRRRHG